MSTNGRSFVYNAPEFTPPPKDDNQSEKSEKENDDLEEIFPEEIQTSIYMQQTNTDYRVVLRMPTIEYSIESTHFLYMKTMTRTEARSFFNVLFYNWHKDATKILLKSR
jgi:hypothetical protein